MDNLCKKIADGVSAGDAIGGPSSLAHILSSSIQERGGFNTAHLASSYLRWWRTDAHDTGPVFGSVFRLVDEGMEQGAAVDKVDKTLDGFTAGCSPAQRISPLAGCLTIPLEQLGDLAKTEARLTHKHPEAGNAAAVVALISRLFIGGSSIADAKSWMMENEAESWNGIQSANISDGGRAYDVVKTALHCISISDNPIFEATKIAGAQNYCPPVVGAFLAALEIGRTPQGHFRNSQHI